LRWPVRFGGHRIENARAQRSAAPFRIWRVGFRQKAQWLGGYLVHYRAEIDGLRAVAVLSVILAHAGVPWLPGGFVGVDVFFVISGFLITRLLCTDLESGTFSILRFYERRVRRILPALVLVVVVCLPFAWFWMLPRQLREFSESVTAVALFFSNVEFWRQSGYFASEAASKPLLHTWSLAVEEQFYIVFPFLLWGLVRSGLRPFALLVGLAVASLALSEWGWRNAPDANFFLIPFRAWELLAGALAALWAGGHRSAPDDRLALSGLALILLSLVLINKETPFPSLWALLPVGGTVMVILWGSAGSVAARLLTSRPVVAVGLISYSAYLWHQPVFAFARIRLTEEPPPITMALLTILTFGLSWATWKWVESPFRRRPVPVLASRARLFVAAALALVFLLLAGATLNQVDRLGIRQLDLPGVSGAERRDLAEGRQNGIRTGICHFNRDRSDGIEAFLRDWSCTQADEAALAPAPIGIFGDSHAADKAHSIRLAGFDLAQMTGAGCPLIPREVTSHCDMLRTAFLDRMEKLGIRTVYLSNSFEASELTTDYLQQLVDFWAPRFERVYLFSPMPIFPGFDEKLQRFRTEDLAGARLDTSLNRLFDAAILEVDLKGVIVLDTERLFCGEGDACSPVDGETRLVDRYHLSAHGAAGFGRALAALPGFPLPQP
jgi:peptidoglycan/LPS O-acetylase OafA/YrhL